MTEFMGNLLRWLNPPNLAHVTILLGAVIIVMRLPMLVAPTEARRWIAAFPRNVWAGRILAAVDLIWVGWLLWKTPLGWFDAYKFTLSAVVPLAFVLTVIYVDELLAPRALGGLLLLVATPILEAARWHDSPARLIMVAVAYIMVFQGIWLVITPYRLRTISAFLIRDSDTRCRVLGLVGVLVGAAVLLLGWLVY